MKRLHKRAQIDLSFGFIFSVILIIFFLAFAIYAIMNFLEMKSKMEAERFLDNLQNDVNSFWKANQGIDEFSYVLPKKIKEVCFIYTDAPEKGSKASIYEELKMYAGKEDNLLFYPIGSSQLTRSSKIERINLYEMTGQENPLCFQNKNGRVTLVLEQEYGGSPLVKIRR